MGSYHSIVMVFVVTFLTSGVNSCSNENKCPEEYTCLGNICMKCLKCDLLYRAGNSCIVDFNECGGCLEGYEEVTVTDDSAVLKPCQPVKISAKIKECNILKGCPPDKYCVEEHCIKCFDCTLVNRLPPPEKCARDLSNCGSCLTGFSEVAVTAGTNFKPCDTPIVKELPCASKLKLFLYVLSILVTLTLYFIIFTHFFFKSLAMAFGVTGLNFSKRFSHNSICPSAPPLELNESPQFIRKLTDVESPIPNCTREQTQQAKVYQLPTAAYYIVDEGRDFSHLRSSSQSFGDNSATLPLNRLDPEGMDSSEEPSQEFLSHRISVDSSDNPTTADQTSQEPNEVSEGCEEHSGTGLDDVSDAESGEINETSSSDVAQVADHCQNDSDKEAARGS